MEDSGYIPITLETSGIEDPKLILSSLPQSGSLFTALGSTNVPDGDPLELQQQFSFIRQWASEVVEYSSWWADPQGFYNPNYTLVHLNAIRVYMETVLLLGLAL